MNAMTEIIPEEGTEVLVDTGGLPKRTNRFRHAFESMPIARKIRSIFIVQLTLLCAIGVAAWWGLGNIESAITAADGNLDESLAATIGTMRWVIFAAIGLAILYSLTAMMHVSQDLVASLTQVSSNMRKLAKGNYDFEIDGLHREDEIGELSRSLLVFRKASLKLDELRAEQEETRQKSKAMMRDLADQFEQTIAEVVGGVATASSQLQVTASSMASSAEQSASQSRDVAKAMDDASGGVTAAASASDEFAMSIGEISRQAASSAELARKASDAAAGADQTIQGLAISAEQIGQIVELIQSIAQRTNLLALNASIEAARGGEAGRGFAVVASEVKELAAQTSKATQDVAGQIQAMQEATGASVTALHSITDQIEKLEATAISIASAVDQQSVAGQDLARSIDIAARGTDEVSANVGQLREAALSTGAAASQVLSSSTELEGQAATLKRQVENFLAHVRQA